MKISKRTLNKLKEKIKEAYDPDFCDWTSERSRGNYDDCFYDGYECGRSWLAYEIAALLEMDLEEPKNE